MQQNNKYWILLLSTTLGWIVVVFSFFWWNIQDVTSIDLIDKLLFIHIVLLIIGLLFRLPFFWKIQNQKKQIDSLVSSHKNFLTLFNSFTAPALLFDKSKDKIVMINKATEEHFHLSPINGIPTGIKEINCLLKQLKEYQSSTIKNLKIENRCIDNDGNEFIFEAIINDIYMQNTPVTLIVLNDKTESEKHLEEINEYIEDLHAKEDVLEENAFELIQLNLKLEESERNLREANASKDKFFSIVAHDLKSPFVGLLGITEMLDTDYNDFEENERREFIHNLYEISKNTYELLEGLLDWARAKQDRIDYRPREFNLYKLAYSIVNLLRANAFKKEIELQIEIDLNATVYADRDMVSTVLRNLLANAIKFTPKNGLIKITSQIENQFMKVSVIDSGIGISEEDQKKLFRIDVNHTTLGTNNEKGTGLGLILCKELIEKNSGTIWVESKLGKGSEFKFTLPLTELADNIPK